MVALLVSSMDGWTAALWVDRSVAWWAASTEKADLASLDLS